MLPRSFGVSQNRHNHGFHCAPISKPIRSQNAGAGLVVPSLRRNRKLERIFCEAVALDPNVRNAVDPDQDLLDRLDRQEGLGAFSIVMLVSGLATLAGLVAYFTLKMELRFSGEIAADTAILVFVVSVAPLGLS
jgi:hypothetical protein